MKANGFARRKKNLKFKLMKEYRAKRYKSRSDREHIHKSQLTATPKGRKKRLG